MRKFKPNKKPPKKLDEVILKWMLCVVDLYPTKA